MRKAVLLDFSMAFFSRPMVTCVKLQLSRGTSTIEDHKYSKILVFT